MPVGLAASTHPTAATLVACRPARRVKWRHGPQPGLPSARNSAMDATSEYRYHRLTWEEMNEAIAAQKVVVLPTGSTEQHGPHLPLDVDAFLAESVCLELGRRAADRVLVLPHGPLRPEPAPHRLPRHDPHRARGLHRLLPERHQERGLSRFREDPDRQRPRVQHAAGRPGGPEDGAGHPFAVRRGELLHPGRGGLQPREARRR